MRGAHSRFGGLRPALAAVLATVVLLSGVPFASSAKSSEVDPSPSGNTGPIQSGTAGAPDSVAPIGPIHSAGGADQGLIDVPYPADNGFCTVLFYSSPLSPLGPACELLNGLNTPGTNGAGGAAVAAQNIATTLDNYLNITNAAAA